MKENIRRNIMLTQNTRRLSQTDCFNLSLLVRLVQKSNQENVTEHGAS